MMFRRKNRLSLHLYLWLFQSHLKKYCGLLCATAFNPKALMEFLADESMAGLGVKGLKRGDKEMKREEQTEIRWVQ
jgi:hypothetical protein